MMLLRALDAETLKLKRTIALKLVLVAPVAVVLLTLFVASQAPFSTLRRGAMRDDWGALARINLQFWGLLMMPLYITLQTALIAGVDHGENQWKALFARPVPRWTVYVAKLLAVMAMTVTSSGILVGGVLLAGVILPHLTAEVQFGSPVPATAILVQAARMTGLAFLPLTIQHWVALRWRAFSVAVGFGIIAIVTAFAMLLAAGQYGGGPQYFPWALPMLVIARYPANIQQVLWISVAIGLVTTVAGCIEFCRRDVS